HSANNTAQALTLSPLTVPNSELRGLNYGKTFNVGAVAVSGKIDLVNGQSQVDVYSFTGKAGDLMTINVASASQNRFGTDVIDPVVEVFDAAGNQVGYYTSIKGAFNDDQFEPNDSTILDLKLPTDGTYYVKVSTFSPDQHGQYALFMYRFDA